MQRLSIPVIAVAGDGIGPEIMEAVLAIHKAAESPLFFINDYYLGEQAVSHNEAFLSERTLKKFDEVKLMLKSPLGTPIGKGAKSPNVQFRQAFNLYINLRPAKSIPAIKTRYDNVDLLLLRENTEDLYSNEYKYDRPENPEEAIITFSLTRKACENIIEAAVQQAQLHNKQRIAVVHKANIIKPYQFFLDAMEKYQSMYSNLAFRSYIVDDYCMKIVEDPSQFDIVVAPNMFGDIISDLHAGMIGGLGVAPSANIGKKHAMFEAVHGTWPQAAGQSKANPTAILLASTMLLRHVDAGDVADNIERAMHHVYASRRADCTQEKLIGGSGTTKTFTNAIIESLS